MAGMMFCFSYLSVVASLSIGPPSVGVLVNRTAQTYAHPLVLYSQRTYPGAWNKTNSLVQSIQDSWGRTTFSMRLGGKDANNDLHIDSSPCADDHQFGLCCKEALQLSLGWQWRDSDGTKADWVFVHDDDVFVVPEHLEMELSKYDPSKPTLAGFLGCGTTHVNEWGHGGQPALCGGPGYAVNSAALDLLIKNEPEVYLSKHRELSEDYQRHAEYAWSDQITSHLAREAGIKFVGLAGMHMGAYPNTSATPAETAGLYASLSRFARNPSTTTVHPVRSPEWMKKLSSEAENSKTQLTAQKHYFQYANAAIRGENARRELFEKEFFSNK